jgi:spore germination protein GerM
VTRRALAALAAVLVAAGCGVPTGGQPTTISASDVPYGLAEPSAPSTSTAPPEVLADTSRVYLLAAGDVLLPRGRELAGSSRRERLADLLAQLAAGPTDAERDEQLSTALPPEVRLTVAALDDGTATIEMDAFAQAPSGVAGRRAVAQIVLTATSVPGVRSVLLHLAGEPIEAPLPSGELTGRPLTADDYLGFTTPAPAAVPAEPPAPAATAAPPS